MSLPIIKIIVVGDSSVGKTSVIQKYVNNTFTLSTMSTTGVDFSNKELEIDGEKVKLQIWDTAGQERFRALAAQYYRRADGICLFYDVTNKSSFQQLQRWLDSIALNASSKIPIILLGNKCDQPDEVPREQAQEFANDKGLKLFFTSAKTGEKLNDAFEYLARLARKVENTKPPTIVFNNNEPEKKNGCC